jgi:hypothetical protein
MVRQQVARVKRMNIGGAPETPENRAITGISSRTQAPSHPVKGRKTKEKMMIAIAPAEEKSRQESTSTSVTEQELSTRAAGLETPAVRTHQTGESAVDRRPLRMRWEFDEARGLRMRWE